jgi:hypothetical protein
MPGFDDLPFMPAEAVQDVPTDGGSDLPRPVHRNEFNHSVTRFLQAIGVHPPCPPEPTDEEIAVEAFSEAFRTVFFDERPRDDVGCGSADCRHDHAALAALGRVCPARAARTLGVRP